MAPKGAKGGQGSGAPDNHLAQFKYAAMSNLVLQADRRFTNRSKDEPTGDPESLAGRINIKDMGSRTARDTVPVAKKPKTGLDVERGRYDEGADVLKQQKKSRGEPAQMRGAGILSQQDLLVEGLKYRPRTPATRATYDLITTIVARSLGDVQAAVQRSAADAVLE